MQTENNKCLNCQKDLGSNSPTNGLCFTCDQNNKGYKKMFDMINKIESPNRLNNTYGWICPICNRGNSPFTPTCPCRMGEIKVTF